VARTTSKNRGLMIISTSSIRLRFIAYHSDIRSTILHVHTFTEIDDSNEDDDWECENEGIDDADDYSCSTLLKDVFGNSEKEMCKLIGAQCCQTCSKLIHI